MATDVITITHLLQANNAAVKVTVPSEIMAFDQTTARVFVTTQTIGTSEEDVVLPADITTPGWCYMRNMDAANYVTWGPKSGGAMVAMGRLEAQDVGSGDFACFRFESSGPPTLRMIANTASVDVQIIIFAA